MKLLALLVLALPLSGCLLGDNTPKPPLYPPGAPYPMYPTWQKDVSLNPTLTWAIPVPEGQLVMGVEYRLQVSRDQNFTQIQTDTIVDTTLFQIGPLEHAETYYWRVQAFNEAGQSHWNMASFTAFKGYQVYNAGEVGDEWVYRFVENGTSGIRKFFLENVAPSIDRATYSFFVSESSCGIDTSKFDLSDPECFPGARTEEATIVWGTDSAVANPVGFPLYFINGFRGSNPPYAVTRTPYRLTGSGPAQTIVFQSAGTGIYSPKISAYYLENVGMLSLVNYQSRLNIFNRDYKLLTFNGKKVPVDSLIEVHNWLSGPAEYW